MKVLEANKDQHLTQERGRGRPSLEASEERPATPPPWTSSLQSAVSRLVCGTCVTASPANCRAGEHRAGDSPRGRTGAGQAWGGDAAGRQEGTWGPQLGQDNREARVEQRGFPLFGFLWEVGWERTEKKRTVSDEGGSLCVWLAFDVRPRVAGIWAGPPGRLLTGQREEAMPSAK